MPPKPAALPNKTRIARFLHVVEWLGNALPHPVTLFALFALSVVLFSGLMGWLGIHLSVATALIASIAIGLSVDDTIHFLTWFRDGISAGMPRNQAIIEAYRRCAAAMTQTTLIGGLGFEASFYGHAATGLLHIRPVIDLHRADDILILEGLNVLQTGMGSSRAFVSDFFDVSIYVDADPDDIRRWMLTAVGSELGLRLAESRARVGRVESG